MNKLQHKIVNVITNSTRAYKVTTIFSLIWLTAISIFFSQPFVKVPEHQYVVILKAFIDSLLFFGYTHVFIRTYLKLNIVGYSLSFKRIGALLAYLFVIAIISVTGDFALAKIELFHIVDVEGLQMTNADGAVEVKLSQPMVYFLAVFNSFTFCIIWAVVYLFFLQHINRKKQQKQLHQAQLQQLTNQLNPHFLFNAFNSIRALIYEDQDKAADTVTLLSELFRTHLKAHLNAKSSLADELEISSNYLAIEKIRLEDRLQLNITIDPQLNAQTLPTLTLLTLVENAIKHGISPNREAGHIEISACSLPKNTWLLKVSNSVNAVSTEDGTRTGLKNVKKRLELMFGSKCGWQQTQSNGVYSVEMELPCD